MIVKLLKLFIKRTAKDRQAVISIENLIKKKGDKICVKSKGNQFI